MTVILQRCRFACLPCGKLYTVNLPEGAATDCPRCGKPCVPASGRYDHRENR